MSNEVPAGVEDAFTWIDGFFAFAPFFVFIILLGGMVAYIFKIIKTHQNAAEALMRTSRALERIADRLERD